MTRESQERPVKEAASVIDHIGIMPCETELAINYVRFLSLILFLGATKKKHRPHFDSPLASDV